MTYKFFYLIWYKLAMTDIHNTLIKLEQVL